MVRFKLGFSASIKSASIGTALAWFFVQNPLVSKLSARETDQDSLKTYTVSPIEVVASKTFVPDTIYEYKFDAVKGPSKIPRTFPDVQKTATFLLSIHDDVGRFAWDPACIDRRGIGEALGALDTTIARLLDFGYIDGNGIYRFKGEDDSAMLKNARDAEQYLKNKKEFVRDALQTLSTHSAGISIKLPDYSGTHVVRIPSPNYIYTKDPEAWQRFNAAATFFGAKMRQPLPGKPIDQELIDVLYAWRKIQEVASEKKSGVESYLTELQSSRSNSEEFLYRFYMTLYYPVGLPANIDLVLAIDSVRSIYKAENVDIECDPNGNKTEKLDVIIKRELADTSIVNRVFAAWDFLKGSTRLKKEDGEYIEVSNNELARLFAPDVYSLLTKVIFPYYKKRYPHKFK